jgi:hypothetical protein
MNDARMDSSERIRRRQQIQRRLTWMAMLLFTITVIVGGGSALLGIAIWFGQPIRPVDTHGMVPASFGSVLFGAGFGALAVGYLFFSPFAFLAARPRRLGRAATVVLSLPFLLSGRTSIGLCNRYFDYGALVVSSLKWVVFAGFGSVLLAHAVALQLLGDETPPSDVTPAAPLSARLRAGFSRPALGAALIFAIATTVYVLRITATGWLESARLHDLLRERENLLRYGQPGP